MSSSLYLMALAKANNERLCPKGAASEKCERAANLLRLSLL
jgi:hypothetical protein